MNVDTEKIVMYTITNYACSVEAIYFEYGLRNKGQPAVPHNGR